MKRIRTKPKINELPIDLILTVVSFLPPEEVLSQRLTCKYWNDSMISNSGLWNELFRIHWGEAYKAQLEKISQKTNNYSAQNIRKYVMERLAIITKSEMRERQRQFITFYCEMNYGCVSKKEILFSLPYDKSYISLLNFHFTKCSCDVGEGEHCGDEKTVKMSFYVWNKYTLDKLKVDYIMEKGHGSGYNAEVCKIRINEKNFLHCHKKSESYGGKDNRDEDLCYVVKDYDTYVQKFGKFVLEKVNESVKLNKKKKKKIFGKRLFTKKVKKVTIQAFLKWLFTCKDDIIDISADAEGMGEWNDPVYNKVDEINFS